LKYSLVKLKSGNLEREVWANLRHFRDASYCEELIRSRHNLKEHEHAGNVRKQAVQIGQCLRQAEEYFEAATAVGPATKPNLLYYGIVSLALATVLLNRTGSYSLDKLRAIIPHRHGLELTNFSNLDPKTSPIGILDTIACTPSDGMFRVWFEALTPDPTVGNATTMLPGGLSQSSLIALAARSKSPTAYTNLGGKKLTAAAMLRQIPDLVPFLNEGKIHCDYCRVAFTSITNEARRSYRFTLTGHHVSSREFAQRLLQRIFICGESPDKIAIRHDGNSFVVSIDTSFPLPPDFGFTMPDARRAIDGQTFLLSDDALEYESAAHFVLMFCLSMLVRYYPDQWVRLLDSGHRSANFLLYFVDLTMLKFPLLTLNELTQSFHYLDG
jgi:YaaC-like Protein